MSNELFRAVPSDEYCWLVNSQLWLHFKPIYKELNGFYPKDDNWSEAEVVQYLDMLEVEAAQEAKYYGA